MQASPNQPDGPAYLQHLLALLRLLRSAGSAVLAQGSLHGKLLAVEWAQEKQRLLAMLLVILLGFACLLVIMLLGAGLVIALSWETSYRIHALLAMIAFYALGLALSWRRLRRLSAQGDEVFAGTRAELAADLALLKSSL